jgi:hypothetical protein
MRTFMATLAALPLCAALCVMPASAAVFPSGPMKTFAFDTTGGVLNPEVLVGFNPQPDPPGFVGSRYIPGEGIVAPGTPDNTFGFLMSFVIPGVSGELTGPGKPNGDGVTTYDFKVGEGDFAHTFDVTLHFAGPGSADSWTWGAFNPQPDPPGLWFSSEIGFAPESDPSVNFSITEDGRPLQLTYVPEPGSWALMLIGVAGLGAVARQSRKAARVIV